MTVRRATTAGVVAVVALGLAGCGGKDDKPDTIEQPSPTATTTPAASPRDTAIKDAKAALTKYYRVTQKLHANPKASHDVLQTVAVGRGLGTVALEIQDYVKNGWHAEGRSSYRVIGVGKV